MNIDRIDENDVAWAVAEYVEYMNARSATPTLAFQGALAIRLRQLTENVTAVLRTRDWEYDPATRTFTAHYADGTTAVVQGPH